MPWLKEGSKQTAQNQNNSVWRKKKKWKKKRDNEKSKRTKTDMKESARGRWARDDDRSHIPLYISSSPFAVYFFLRPLVFPISPSALSPFLKFALSLLLRWLHGLLKVIELKCGCFAGVYIFSISQTHSPSTTHLHYTQGMLHLLRF